MRRSGKYYRRNEAEVMRALGLEPTKRGMLMEGGDAQ